MKPRLYIAFLLVFVAYLLPSNLGKPEHGSTPLSNPYPILGKVEIAHAEQAQVTKVPVNNKEIGLQEALKLGWAGDQWSCLERLWTNESGWNENAHNVSSGAHGIAQALPASKMATQGSDYMTNPRVQIQWGLSYIQQRYNNPCSALSFWLSNSPHWY